jgi:predicted phage terminase large subunit-like protein
VADGLGIEELTALARSSPAGLAYVANLDTASGVSGFQLPAHLSMLNREIQAAAIGELRAQGYRGIIFTVGPRHGKSFLTSQYTPAWFLGSFPHKSVGLASYEADFAATWGRRAREVLEEHGPQYFGVKVDPGSRASSYWRVRAMANREVDANAIDVGSMVTAGIGGPLTGRGIHCLIVDDPVKNAIEAHSKTKRESVWSWWTSTAATRLEPDGFAIIIMTRWHDDDLAGRLLRRQDEDGWKWKYVNIPTLAVEDDPLGRAPGEALWPARYPATELHAIRAGLGSYVWNSLYQGKPSGQTGGYFDADWLKVVDAPLDGAVKGAVRYWDLAGTEQDGDYLAGVRMERMANDKYVVTDVVRGQFSSAGVEASICDTAKLDGPGTKIRIAQERGAAGKLFVDIIKRKLPGFNVRGDVEHGDKGLRARPLSATAERGDLYVVNGPWTQKYLEEMVQFDHGANDDQVDGSSGGFKALQRGGQAVSF